MSLPDVTEVYNIDLVGSLWIYYEPMVRLVIYAPMYVLMNPTDAFKVHHQVNRQVIIPAAVIM